MYEPVFLIYVFWLSCSVFFFKQVPYNPFREMIVYDYIRHVYFIFIDLLSTFKIYITMK